MLQETKPSNNAQQSSFVDVYVYFAANIQEELILRITIYVNSSYMTLYMNMKMCIYINIYLYTTYVVFVYVFFFLCILLCTYKIFNIYMWLKMQIYIRICIYVCLSIWSLIVIGFYKTFFLKRNTAVKCQSLIYLSRVKR